MKRPPLLRHSLKTRITLFTLAIFVIGVATVTLWSRYLLRHDMQVLLEQQQVSIASMLAAEINHELADRVRAIKQAAADISPELLANASALQQHLQQRPQLQAMFNAGTFVTSRDGTAVVSLPTSSQRVGISYKAFDFVETALTRDKATIGKPAPDPQHKQPLVSMAAPIHHANGQVIGALVGVIDLGKTNFFHDVVGNHYGRSGGIMLVDKANRLIVTATDDKTVLQALPAPGVDPPTDKFVAGFEGSDIATTPRGERLLMAAKGIPVANWYLAIHQPTLEIFAPISALQERLWWAIALLTMLTASLIWWMLQRQLSPMVSAAATLAALPSNSSEPARLPVAYDDEIGHLINGFNQLLDTLQLRKQTLKESEERFRTLTEWTPEALLVHRDDELLYANPAAVRLFGASSAQELIGQSMRDLVHPDDRQATLERNPQGAQQGPHPLREQKFLRLDGSVFDAEASAIAIAFNGQPAVQTAAHDITERKRAELALQHSLRDKDALLNEVHHRVKNNLQIITSLLRLEAARSDQPDSTSVLQEMQGRIRTMALLHETLYDTGTYSSVNLADYLKLIATQAFRAQSRATVQLQLALHPVQVSMDMATPCGLLVNELISNALKHAFPDSRPGMVCISLRPAARSREGRPTWCMCVSDNGVGLPVDFEQRRDQSLGLQLACDLARQLDSMLAIQSHTDTSDGASFSVLISPPA